MPKPKLFISYSWKDLDLARRVEAYLSARFDVFRDEGRIAAGAEIDERVDEELDACDAAVVLMSEHANKRSNWVPYEAGALHRRAKNWPDRVKVVPVLVDGADPGLFDRGDFGPVRWGNRLAGQLTSPPTNEQLQLLDAEFDAFVHDFEKRGELVDEIKRDLYVSIDAVSGPNFDQIVDLVLTDAPGFSSPNARTRWVAVRVLSADLKTFCLAVCLTNRSLANDGAFDLLYRFGPHAWIEEQTASGLRSSACSPTGKTLVFASNEPEIVRGMVARRAQPSLNATWVIVPCLEEPDDDPAEALFRGVSKALCRKLRLRGACETDVVALRDGIEHRRGVDGAVVVLLPPRVLDLDDAVFARLARLDNVVFLAVEEELPADLADRLGHVELLHHLDLDTENDDLFTLQTAVEKLEKELSDLK